MRKIFLALAVLASVVGLSACSKVPAGNVGVKVQLLGSDKGVGIEELTPGRYWLGWNEELFLFPTFTQNETWSGEGEGGQELKFQDRDGLIASADVGLSYSVDPDKATELFQKYRRGIDEITDVYLRNMVRDALVKRASNQPLEYLYGPGKTELIDGAQVDVASQVVELGIRIEKLYWIGAIRLPPEIDQRIKDKIAASQMTMQRRQEVEQAKAEADKKIEEARGVAQSILVTAKAQAEANQILSSSLTPQLVQYRTIDKWDGILPKFTGSAAVPFVDVTQETVP